MRKNMGIYIQETKTFYYLEGGGNYIGNKVERVRKALIQRGLIKPTLNTNYSKATYEIIGFADAEKNGYEKQPIYLSKHIQSIFQDNKSETGGNFK